MPQRQRKKTDMSDYSFFARFYDGLTQNVDYERRAEHFSALLLSYGVESGTVLDLACGTGTLTSLIASRGYEMIGVDSSPLAVDLLVAEHLRNNYAL